MLSLHGRVAVISGCSNIGRATAFSLAQRGARIVVADSDAAAAESVAAELVRAGGEAVGGCCDPAAESAFDELKSLALCRFGQIDVVMNNVDVVAGDLPDHLPMEEWRRIMEVNLFSVVRSNIAFVPLLIEQGHGHIVNTVSVAGLFTYSYDGLPYAASKAAIVQISEGLRLYLRPKGVGVTVLCPGPVFTGLGASALSAFGPETVTLGPGLQLELLDVDVVGEQVAEAIMDDSFMLCTHREVRDMLVERAGDWSAYIDRQADAIAY